MPWTSRESARERLLSIPVGGDGGVRNPNLPPPSRPENDDIEVRPDERIGVPYPEWNIWTKRFLADHVAVLERPLDTRRAPSRWRCHRRFGDGSRSAPTGSMRNGLEDGCDLDIDPLRRPLHRRRDRCGTEPRVFRDLVPGFRDVTTALLLDGSSSLGAQHGKVFELELECADSLSQAMTLARERHGIFVFSGNTRHRVDVRCLKDFDQPRFVAPSSLGLVAGGYTRLGAPIRHLTSRLLAQASERRLLILIGDGLMSDEGYEGHYAWADVAHAVEEADEAGVAIYYIGVGTTRVDPLPEVFGPAARSASAGSRTCPCARPCPPRAGQLVEVDGSVRRAGYSHPRSGPGCSGPQNRGWSKSLDTHVDPVAGVAAEHEDAVPFPGQGHRLRQRVCAGTRARRPCRAGRSETSCRPAEAPSGLRRGSPA